MRSIVIILLLFCLAVASCQRQEVKVAEKPAQPLPENALTEMREYIEEKVASGFESAEEIAQGSVEYLSDQYDAALLTPHAASLTGELLAAHKKEQASWPKITDCDRLDAAFAALERAGIVARQDFTCCGTCGVAEIQDEMDATTEGGKSVRGYTFYHMQDTERAVRGYGIYLNYGSVEKGEEANVQVGKEIVSALEQQGLKVDWDNSWSHRIAVTMDWKRRR